MSADRDPEAPVTPKPTVPPHPANPKGDPRIGPGTTYGLLSGQEPGATADQDRLRSGIERIAKAIGLEDPLIPEKDLGIVVERDLERGPRAVKVVVTFYARTPAAR